MFKFRIRLSIITLVSLGCFLFYTNTVHAEEKRFYVGLAGNYLLTNLNLQLFEQIPSDQVAWDSYALGANAKFGYRLVQSLFLQLDVDYIPSIDGKYSLNRAVGGEIKILTGMISLKGYFPNLRIVKPYVLAGAGIMHYNIDPNTASERAGLDIKENRRTSPCYKVGGGIDFMISRHFSIGLDGNYTVGTNQVEDVEYFNFGLGLAVHF